MKIEELRQALNQIPNGVDTGINTISVENGKLKIDFQGSKKKSATKKKEVTDAKHKSV